MYLSRHYNVRIQDPHIATKVKSLPVPSYRPIGHSYGTFDFTERKNGDLLRCTVLSLSASFMHLHSDHRVKSLGGVGRARAPAVFGFDGDQSPFVLIEAYFVI